MTDMLLILCAGSLFWLLSVAVDLLRTLNKIYFQLDSLGNVIRKHAETEATERDA